MYKRPGLERNLASDAQNLIQPEPAPICELRDELTRRQLDGFVVPLADEHLSEYVGSYAQRLAWLTGFLGSAGTAVVLSDKAAIFVDGRYAAQVRQQVDPQIWSIQAIRQCTPVDWLREHAHQGARVGYDPWLHTVAWDESASAALRDRGIWLEAVTSNPVDTVWIDRPRPSNAKLSVHPEHLAGVPSIKKRQDIAHWLRSLDLRAVILSALDSVAWTFNVRGNDIVHTPVSRAFALVNADTSADLFVDPGKLSHVVLHHLGDGVRLHPYDGFANHLSSLGEQRVAVDPKRTAAAVNHTLKKAGAKVVTVRDPTILPKATKNDTEIAGHKTAQTRDAVAVCLFLHWLSVEAPKGGVTELSAAQKLRELREAGAELRDISFETISGFGPNAAIIHYHPDERTNRHLEIGGLYLVDSGGQYGDGTTDVARTVAIGTPSNEMRDRFTRALKGHLALANIVFPEGTRGSQLDALARQYLWAAGVDYAHGTGHGVGSYLCVHEEPQRILKAAAPFGLDDDPLAPGMIVSNEPGYYKAGSFGIRIENLMLVVRREVANAECRMLGFETLTFAPIDRVLIDTTMLTKEERGWIDSYHAQVAILVGPLVDEVTRNWLESVTRSLD